MGHLLTLSIWRGTKTHTSVWPSSWTPTLPGTLTPRYRGLLSGGIGAEQLPTEIWRLTGPINCRKVHKPRLIWDRTAMSQPDFEANIPNSADEHLPNDDHKKIRTIDPEPTSCRISEASAYFIFVIEFRMISEMLVGTGFPCCENVACKQKHYFSKPSSLHSGGYRNCNGRSLFSGKAGSSTLNT